MWAGHTVNVHANAKSRFSGKEKLKGLSGS